MKQSIFLLLLVLCSCAVTKREKKLHVELEIQIHKPYCGGAKPTETMGHGTVEPYANTVFYVKTNMNHEKKENTVKLVKTDGNGKVKLKIHPGTYVLIQEDKVLSYEDFMKKYNTPKPEQFIEYIGDELAKKQYETADFEMAFTEAKKYQFTYESNCFSGLNPCLKYTGPKPQ